MTTPLRALSLRALALCALLATPGCLGKVGEPYLDNWMTSWKFVDGVSAVDGESIPDGRFRVTGKDDFSAAFAWVPYELGEDAEVDGSFRFEKPAKITGDALTGIQLSALGPEIPIFLLIQSLLQGNELVLNVFAQAGSELVFQETIIGQSHVDLGVKVGGGAFHFYVDDVKKGETPIPNPDVDWIAGYGFSGLGKGEQVALESAMILGGAASGSHTDLQLAKRAVFKATEPIQAIVKANDGGRQAGADLVEALKEAKSALTSAVDEVDAKVTDAKLRDAVKEELFDALGKVNKLIKKFEKNAAKGKEPKPKKVRKLAAKLLRKVALAGLLLATPPSNMPTPN